MRLSGRTYLMLAVAVAVLLVAPTGLYSNEQVETMTNWYLFNAGGGYDGTTTYTLMSSLGQSIAGVTGTGNYFVTAGFVSDSAPLPLKVVEVETPTLPTAYSLSQNYPNPFNPTTTIEFSLPRSGFVTLDVFDVQGRRVATLVSEQLQAGLKRVDWDGRDRTGSNVASGVYFYRLRANDFSSTRKMLLLK
jgi:hypothetical protein